MRVIRELWRVASRDYTCDQWCDMDCIACERPFTKAGCYNGKVNLCENKIIKKNEEYYYMVWGLTKEDRMAFEMGKDVVATRLCRDCGMKYLMNTRPEDE